MVLVLPGALTLYLGFVAGGFYPGSVGVAAAVVAGVLALRIGVAERPFEGVSVVAGVAGGALACFAGWTLASEIWSGTASRAILEFDRALLYLLTLVLFMTLRWTSGRARVALAGVASAFGVLALAGFFSRVAPDFVSLGIERPTARLSYPLTYWNSEGLVCTLGIVLCVHLSAASGSRVFRALACVPIPLFAATLLLTFSRGAIAALAIGLFGYVVAARERGVAFTALAAVPGAFVSARAAYDADLLARQDFISAAAQTQGDHLAITVAACCISVLVLRLLLTVVEAAVADRWRLDGRRRLMVSLAGATIVLVAVTLIVVNAPGRLSDSWTRFKQSASSSSQERDRLTQVSNNGRIAHWKVARDAFQTHQFHGTGAGTFQVLWAQHRHSSFTVIDAHSLPLEVAAELGVVGLAFLGVTLMCLLGGALWRARGPDRALFAVVFAAGLAWLARACIDWDWEMPAVTLWLFALGGLALARRTEARAAVPSRVTRLVAMLIALALAVLPVQAALSQYRLNQAVSAFQRGDCGQATNESLAASSALSARPEPLQVLAFCDARLGQGPLSIEIARKAIQRDPKNWEFQYSLALVQGASRQDPRVAAARALRLNPREPLARAAVRRFRTSSPQRWQRAARSAPLPFQGRRP